MSPGPPLYTRTFWAACAIHFTGGMSLGMFLLFPLFVRALGGDELTIGLVLGAGMAASVALRPAVGALLDRVGRRRVLLGASAVNAASFPLFLLVGTPGPALYLLGALHLVAGGALFAAYFTYAADLVPPARRVEGIAIFGVAGMAPNGLGPALGEWVIAWGGFAPFFLVATAWALVSLLLVAGMREEPRPTHHEAHAGAREAVRLVLRGGLAPLLAATLLFGAGINAAYYFVAPFTRAVGIEHAAPFFAAYATTTIVLRIFGRQLPDRLGAHPVALPAFAVFAVGLATLSLLPVPGALVFAGIACGAGHGTLFPVLNALAVSRTPARLQGVVVSLYTGALDAGAVLGTPLCGAVARTSYRAMFLMMALASLVGLALLALDRRRSGAAALRRAAAVVLVAALARPALAAEWPQLSSGPLEDNSFLIEEAYNQEAGVAQHILSAVHDRASGGWVGTFTQEWPVPDQRHQLSYTVPFTFAGERDGSTGVGDVLLNYRHQLLAEEGRRPALAPRLSLVLPTGSVRDGLGNGSAGVQAAVPLSKQLGTHFATHWNAGVSVLPHALAVDPPQSERLVSWYGGGSLVWQAADAVNLLAELLVLRDAEIGTHGVEHRTRAVFDPGIRVGWNGPASVQWVGGIGFPIGLTRDTDDFGVLLYMSVEHAVTAAAREERRW